MAKQERLEIIKKIQNCRKSKVILYILGDREPAQLFSTVVAVDSIPLLQKILKGMGHSKRISLVLHSRGGNLDTPWPFVNLLREFTDDFEVLVPRRALSAATLICLGAERIVMSPFSHLSPIDPQRALKNVDGKMEPIAIEDIIAFIEFSKQKIGLKDRQGKIEILKALHQIDAKELGSFNRVHALIRKLSSGLLQLRKKKKLTKAQIDEVVVNLIEKTYSHSHLIGRLEAKNQIGLGPMIESADEKTYELMESLYEQLDSDLELSKTFDLQAELAKSAPNPATIDSLRCVMQSEVINFEGNSKIVFLPNGQIQPGFAWELV